MKTLKMAHFSTYFFILQLSAGEPYLLSFPLKTLFSVGRHCKEEIEAALRHIVQVAQGIQKQEFESKTGSYCHFESPRYLWILRSD